MRAVERKCSCGWVKGSQDYRGNMRDRTGMGAARGLPPAHRFLQEPLDVRAGQATEFVKAEAGVFAHDRAAYFERRQPAFLARDVFRLALQLRQVDLGVGQLERQRLGAARHNRFHLRSGIVKHV